MKNNFKQGIYKPMNSKKYIGKGYPTYRSGWELKFFKWADGNDRIVKWGSENVVIPYLNPLDNKVRRYFVDNYIVYKDKEGNLNKFLVEIKPLKQTKKPKKTPFKKNSTMLYEQKMYVQNISKWKAAEKWAEKKKCKFIIITEKELNMKWK
jgi:hypothetical protein